MEAITSGYKVSGQFLLNPALGIPDDGAVGFKSFDRTDRGFVKNRVAFGSEAPVSQENGSVSDDLRLAQNAPNPFSDQTMIRFTLPAQDHVQVMVYNHLGQQVATVVDGVMGAGAHEVLFDATDLASGTYFYRLSYGAESETRSMILVR